MQRLLHSTYRGLGLEYGVGIGILCRDVAARQTLTDERALMSNQQNCSHESSISQSYRGLGLPLVGELLELSELVLSTLVGGHGEGDG